MAYELFITTEDLKRYSALSGSIDEDKLVQFTRIAMDIHITNYLGSDLFDRLQAGITAADLTAGETALINDHIKWMTIHWTLTEVFGFIAYTVSNKGVYKHFAENSEAVSKEEIDTLIQRHRDIAQSYTRKFIKYMKFNKSSFPEYTSNTNEEIDPSKTSKFGGWQLD